MRQSISAFIIFLLIISSNFQTLGQTSELEPNNNVGDSGVKTISSIGNYSGSISSSTDQDVWKIAAGSSSIGCNFSGVDSHIGILFVPYDGPGWTNKNAGAGFSASPGAAFSNRSIDPNKFWTIVLYNNSTGSYLYTMNVTDGTLPVELTSFTAVVNGSSVNLKWQTATEVQNYGFEVQRSAAEGEPRQGREARGQRSEVSNWEKIGFVAGAGNSNSPKYYSFTDQPTGGTSFSYRLKQIDNDGHYKYYDAITVTLSSSSKAELMQNSPNPFNPTTAIKFFIPNSSDVTIKIYDMLGREVTTLVNNQTEAGYHIVYWNGRDSYGRDAASGVYLYRLTVENLGGSRTGSFSETKKMSLLR